MVRHNTCQPCPVMPGHKLVRHTIRTTKKNLVGCLDPAPNSNVFKIASQFDPSP
jgi:hypothetical protein